MPSTIRMITNDNRLPPITTVLFGFAGVLPFANAFPLTSAVKLILYIVPDTFVLRNLKTPQSP